MIAQYAQPIASSPTTWVEVATDESVRMTITPDTPHIVKRRLYPFSLVAIAGQKVHGLAQDELVAYARVKLQPSHYPIEALVRTADGKIYRRCAFQASEVDVVEPVTP